MELCTCAFARNLVDEITVKELQLQLRQMMSAPLASRRIVFVALYRNFDFAISAAGLAEDVQLFFECHYQTDPSYGLVWSGLVILRVSRFHSPNNLGIYHKMFTFGAKNRPPADLFAADDVTCDIYVKRVRDARVGLVPKIFGKARESIFSTYIYIRLYNISSFK